MLDLVKVFPSSFLVASAPADSGMPEVPPEVPMRRLPLKDQRTARDGTYECCWPRVERGFVVRGFRKGRKGSGVVWYSLVVFRGGKFMRGQVTSGGAFIGIVRHN